MAAIPDKYIFLVEEDSNGFTVFLKVCEPNDFSRYSTTGSPRRTDTIDCYLPSDAIGKQFMEAIKEDVRLLVESYQPAIETYLSGGKRGLYEETKFERR